MIIYDWYAAGKGVEAGGGGWGNEVMVVVVRQVLKLSPVTSQGEREDLCENFEMK